MRGGSSEHLNELLRGFMRARRGRSLTDAERGVYRELLAEWNAASKRERLCQADVVEVA